MVTAPTTGPAKVPMPPSRVSNTTSPDSDQCASDRVAKPSTRVFSAPARPAIAADVVAQRDGTRLVLADGFEHLAVGRVHDADDGQEHGDKDRQHDAVQRQAAGEFMPQLAALVPRPRLHLIRFHGVLAPNAKLRALVVPQGPEVSTERVRNPPSARRTARTTGRRCR